MPAHYLERSRTLLTESRTIPAAEITFEFMMNVLRLTEGCPSALFEQRTSLSLATLSDKTAGLQQRGLLLKSNDRLRATEMGLRYLNELLLAFL